MGEPPAAVGRALSAPELARANAASRATVAVLAGALPLAWPAILNGYPLVTADTAAYLAQSSEPSALWDRPFVYGPFLLALHGGTTLWLPMAAQAAMLSALLWLVRAGLGDQPPGERPSAGRHVALCAALALLSPAPWTASLLLPDVFAPVTVITLFLLGFSDTPGRPSRRVLIAIGGLAIAADLSHLLIAAALVITTALLRPPRASAVAAPLGLALLLLVASNAIVTGRFGVAPFASVVALARLATDGPAQDVLARDCPDAGWHLCAWAGRLPADSEAFLHDPAGPVLGVPGGPRTLAPEAAVILARTLAAEPGAVALDALANAARQATSLRLGDTLGTEALPEIIDARLRAQLPPEEQARFKASLQARGMLADFAEPVQSFQGALILAAAQACAALIVLAARRHRATVSLAVFCLVAVAVNAFATGALAGPRDHTQLRIAWLLLLPPLLHLQVRLRRPPR